MNTLFLYFEKNPIRKLEELSNDITLKNLLISIEPNLNVIKLIDNSNFQGKYTNLVNIINKVTEYVLSLDDNSIIKNTTNFKSTININEIINNDKKALYKLFEMIIFVSAISSNTESFDRLETCDENLISFYLQIIQKYTNKFDSNDDNNNTISGRVSRVSRVSKTRKSMIETYKRQNEEIEEKNSIIDNLQMEISNLEMKNKEYLSELENLNILKENNSILSSDLFKEKERNDRMQGIFEKKDEEKEKTIKSLEEKLKTINYKHEQLNDKYILIQNELNSYKDLKKENEKLKNKVKDLHLIKEKDAKIQELEIEIENKNINIKNLNNDKEILNKKIAQLTIEKFTLEEEKRNNLLIQNKLKSELEEQKKEYKILDNKMKSLETSIQTRISLSRISRLSVTNNNTIDDTNDINLEQIQFENEIENLKYEKEELKSEIQELKNKINEINTEKNKILGEKNVAILEKEKCLESFQQNQLDKQNMQIKYQQNIKEYEKKINEIKNDYLIKEKEKDKEILLLKEEIETLKDNEIKIKETMININKEEIDKLTFQCMNLKNENEELFIKMQKEQKLLASAFSNIAFEILEYKTNKNKTKSQKLEEIPHSFYDIERKKNFPSVYYDY